jgi:hypothetical protein
MFKKICRELGGIRFEIKTLVSTLRMASGVLQSVTEGAVDPERLAKLEGRLEAVVGEVQAGVIKADALKATARAAEDRARGHMKRAEGYAKLVTDLEDDEETDPFEAAGRAFDGVVPERNDEANGGVHVLPNSVADRRQGRELAKAAKRR